jgi:hypothetical protein
MSPRMAAIVGFVVGEEWTQPVIEELHVTGDGFVMARRGGDIGCNDFIGAVSDLERNWENLLVAAGLSGDEVTEARRLYAVRIKDWRILGR